MTTYVDELRRWPTTIRCFKAGSCHLPHYDLTPARRERALELGAVFITAKQQARARLANASRRPASATAREQRA